MLTDDDLDNLRDLAKRQGANHAEKKILAAMAEVERLRVYVSGARCPHCDELRLELGEARGEIERLRKLCIDFMVPMDVVNGLRQAGRPFGWEGK